MYEKRNQLIILFPIFGKKYCQLKDKKRDFKKNIKLEYYKGKKNKK